MLYLPLGNINVRLFAPPFSGVTTPFQLNLPVFFNTFAFLEQSNQHLSACMLCARPQRSWLKSRQVCGLLRLYSDAQGLTGATLTFKDKL